MRTIRQMEADLGVPLLNRLPRSVRLTPGRVFLEPGAYCCLRASADQGTRRSKPTEHAAHHYLVTWGEGPLVGVACALPRSTLVGFVRIFETPLAQLVTGLRNDV